MFDTILFCLKRECHAPRKMQELNFFPRGGKIPDEVASRPFRWYANFPLVNGASVRLHWSLAPDGEDYLSAEASLPAVLFGSNVSLLNSDEDIKEAVESLAHAVSQLAHVDYDAWQARIGRLDAVHQWQVGAPEVHARLLGLQRAHMARMKRLLVEDGTVYFQNKTQQFVLYSKHDQIANLALKGKASYEDLRAAEGLFRAERRFRSAYGCRKLARDLGLPDRKAVHLLRENVATIAVKEMMMQLKLDQPLEAGDSRLPLLLKFYGRGQRYQRLAGFLSLCDEHGPDNLAPFFMSAKTFKRQSKEIEDAGAWLSAPSRQTFPPLRLVRSTPAEQRLIAYV